MTVEELLDSLPESGIEGVTLLGGEPFEQAPALAEFARAVRERDLSVMTFSGFTFDELVIDSTAGVAGVEELLAQTDLLVDGPFRLNEIDTVRPWVGSRNQGMRSLTNRYRSLQDAGWPFADRVEVRISADGTIGVNGWATTEALESLLRDPAV